MPDFRVEATYDVITLGEGSLTEMRVPSCAQLTMSLSVDVFGSVGRFGLALGVRGPFSRSVPSVEVQATVQRKRETGTDWISPGMNPT